MRVFGFSKRKNGKLSAMCDGAVFSVEKTADEVFSNKILGDGFAQTPESNTVLSPADGVVSEVAETGHAYCIDTDDGLQLLVHIGIDTVKLGGEGFSPCVKKGDRVGAGSPLARVDFDLLRGRGYDCTVIAVVTNMQRLSSYEACAVAAKGGRDTAFVYSLGGGGLK